jgi:hypothetical protein
MVFLIAVKAQFCHCHNGVIHRKIKEVGCACSAD